MKVFKSLIAGVSLFAVACVADYEIEEDVLVLGDDTLASAIEEIPFLLVEFYAPWCGHCKQLAPEYAKAAGELAPSEDIKLAKVDATVHSAAAAKYDVSGYPTIKFFKNGEASDYNGGRTSGDIVSWMLSKAGPSVTDIQDFENFEKLKEENPIMLVLYTTETGDDSKILNHFTKFADSEEVVACFLVSDAEIAKKMDIAENSVALFKNYDEGRADYTEEKVTKSKLQTFVKPHLLPYVVEFSDDVVQRLFGGEVKEHLIYFRKDAKSEASEAVVESMREVAKTHQGELIFVAVDLDESSNGRLAEFFGISDKDLPTVRIIDISDQPKKFTPSADFAFTKEGFESFASDYLAGKLSPSLNSEDVPSDWDAEPLKVVVGANFDEVVLNEETNTLLMAHAPWCGHCKSLMPVFEELAEHFEDDDKIVIAKMDATKNEVTTFSVSGFPTLKFFPSNGDMMDYEGGRELDALIEFVDKNRGDAEPVDEEEEVDEEVDEDLEEEDEKDEL